MKLYDLYEFSVEEMLFPEGKSTELYTEGRVRTPESFTVDIGRYRQLQTHAHCAYGSFARCPHGGDL